jgi:hypothetical protein
MPTKNLERYLERLTELGAQHPLHAATIAACASLVEQQYNAAVQKYGDSVAVPPPAPGATPLAMAFPLPYQEGTALRDETTRTEPPPSLASIAKGVFGTALQTGALTQVIVTRALQDFTSRL